MPKDSKPRNQTTHSVDDFGQFGVNHRTTPPAQNPIPKWLVPTAFVFGIVLFCVIIILVIKIPSPSQFQATVFRILIALAGAAFSMGITGFLTVRLHFPHGGLILAGGSLGVFVVPYFFNPAIPGISNPLVDSRGDLLESPANPTELEVIRLQDEIMDLRQYKESVQQPDSRRKLQNASYLAERILSFDDDKLNVRRRFIKYEFGTFAYVDAASAAMFDDRPKVEVYASQAIKNANTALSMLSAAENSYQSNEESRFLLDWIVKHEGKDRVLYLLADAECMLGTTKNDAALRAQASKTWEMITSTYREGLPASGTPQVSGCVSR